MRVAIWGNLTLHSSAPQVQGETHMSHFMGRHQLMSTHEDAKYTSTGTCENINVRMGLNGICEVRIGCIHTLA